MPVTLINVFKVPLEHEDRFLRDWNETTGVYARTEGFIDTRMHRNIGVGSPTFTFINVATWASNEAFIQAHKDYVPNEESIPGIEFHPAIYGEIIAVKNLLSRQSEGTE